jgi:uncharacterized protein YktA (UPF0223 family)
MNVLYTINEVINSFQKHETALDSITSYEQFMKLYNKFKKNNNNTIILEKDIKKLDIILSKHENLKIYKISMSKILSNMLILIKYEIKV